LAHPINPQRNELKDYQVSYDRVCEIAQSLGLETLSLASTSTLEEGKKKLKFWQSQGYAAEMKFMKREPELLSSPLEIFPAARSVLLFIVPYDTSQTDPRMPGYGRVARYAWGRDYHIVLKERLLCFVEKLKRETEYTFQSKIFVDAVPLLERALAQRAGLGFFGRNTMLILKGIGSFFFIAELISDLEILGCENGQYSGGCGGCARCIEKCPTHAISDQYLINSNRCISYLTIEKRGVLDLEEQESIGDWLFGCDLCQDCCPFNHRTLQKSLGSKSLDFAAQSGPGQMLELSDILQIRDVASFKKRFQGTAILRCKREGLLRNAAAVAANTKADCTVSQLVEAFERDASPIVRSSAISALIRLSQYGAGISKKVITSLRSRAIADVDDMVRRVVLSFDG